MPGLGKCTKCGKTVYDIEGYVVGPPKKTQCFHKICFKCSVCGWTLNMNTYKFYDDKVYCGNHYPVTGFGVADHVTGNKTKLSLSEETMKNAPKLDTVNEQVRGTNEKPHLSTNSMGISNALNVPKLGTINEQVKQPQAKANYCTSCGTLCSGKFCGSCGEKMTE